jgi:alkyl sulfatase BDS1-like metallo-beta-lactamase superfamily hydrolase
MGWYDANPVNLNLLSPERTAQKLVEYLGDTESVLAKAREDFEAGEYQWVAQITKELVYADPKNQAARELCADALEQLGYQAESGTWRNAYLTGALELRMGNQAIGAPTASGLNSTLMDMTAPMLLDYIAIITDANAAQHDELSLNLIFTDTGESFYVRRINGVLLSYPGEKRENAQGTVTCAKSQLLSLLSGAPVQGIKVEGDLTVLKRLVQYAQAFDGAFNIIEP